MINEACPCIVSCSRHGNCESCRTYHKSKCLGLVACKKLENSKQNEIYERKYYEGRRGTYLCPSLFRASQQGSRI